MPTSGIPEWAAYAPGLKSVEDATEIRRRMLLAFEIAERHARLNQKPERSELCGGGRRANGSGVGGRRGRDRPARSGLGLPLHRSAQHAGRSHRGRTQNSSRISRGSVGFGRAPVE